MVGSLRNRRPWLLLVAVLVASALAAPVASAQTKDDVERATADREAALARLIDVRTQAEDAIERYDDLREEIFEVSYQLDRLDTRISRDQSEASDLRSAVRRLLVEAYVRRTPSVVGIALQADSIQDIVTRQTLLDRANALAVASLDRLNAVSRDLDRLSSRFKGDRTELEGLEIEAQGALEQVNLLLDLAEGEFSQETEAVKEAKKLYEAALARKRAAAAAAARAAAARSKGSARSIGGLTCPQATQMFFRNDWGNRRSGGRTHKGTDIFGSKGKKVYAVIGGSLRTRTGGLGGTALWLFGNDGNAYYYAHLDGWAGGVTTGTRVKQGELIAFVGNTGNASGGANHTHFEIHPGGGSAINPYWTLAQVCNR